MLSEKGGRGADQAVHMGKKEERGKKKRRKKHYRGKITLRRNKRNSGRKN